MRYIISNGPVKHIGIQQNIEILSLLKLIFHKYVKGINKDKKAKIIISDPGRIRTNK